MPSDKCVCMHMHKFFCVYVLLWRINLLNFLINVQDYLFIQKTFTLCPHCVVLYIVMVFINRSDIKGDWIALVILETFVSLNVLFHSPGIAVCQLLSSVRLFATPWTLFLQANLSVKFSRQHWSGLSFPSPRHCFI